MRRICERVWRSYKLFMSLTFTARKGVELVGLTEATSTPVDVAETFRRRGESVLEHSARVALLVSLFASNFPQFFGSLREVVAGLTWEQLTVTALCHDIGEVVLGDIPDDGRPEHAAKANIEYQVFQDLIYAFTASDAERMARLFVDIDDPTTHAAMGIKGLDKLEANLSQLYLEQYEAYGLITDKPAISASDRHFMRITGTPSSTDGWAAHTLSITDAYPPEIADPIRMLLDVAVRDVRGEPFPWCSTRPVPPWDGT